MILSDLNRYDSNFIQIELWRYCTNSCKFCYNQNCKIDIKTEEYLDKVLNFLENDAKEIKNIDKFSFLGGEIFSKKFNDHESKVLKIYKTVRDDFKNSSVYFYTNFLYSSLGNIKKSLDIFSENHNRLTICTSYDTLYRFSGENMVLLWKNNFFEIKKLYPDIKFNIEVIMSEHMIDSVMKGNFNLHDISEEFGSDISLTQAYDFTKNGLDNFLPSRDKFFKFLTYLRDNDFPLYKVSNTKNEPTLYISNKLDEGFVFIDHDSWKSYNLKSNKHDYKNTSEYDLLSDVESFRKYCYE